MKSCGPGGSIWSIRPNTEYMERTLFRYSGCIGPPSPCNHPFSSLLNGRKYTQTEHFKLEQCIKLEDGIPHYYVETVIEPQTLKRGLFSSLL